MRNRLIEAFLQEAPVEGQIEYLSRPEPVTTSAFNGVVTGRTKSGIDLIKILDLHGKPTGEFAIAQGSKIIKTGRGDGKNELMNMVPQQPHEDVRARQQAQRETDIKELGSFKDLAKKAMEAFRKGGGSAGPQELAAKVASVKQKFGLTDRQWSLINSYHDQLR